MSLVNVINFISYFLNYFKIRIKFKSRYRNTIRMNLLTNTLRNLDAEFSKIDSYWSPRIVGEINQSYLKIAKLKGDFFWHKHENEDELFIIQKGALELEFEDKTVQMNKGDFFVVPKGVMHRPHAKEECWVILMELKETLHTGTENYEQTKSIEEQLK